MLLALGVAGLILLTGTDLSIGRMVGMGTVSYTHLDVYKRQGLSIAGADINLGEKDKEKIKDEGENKEK